MTNKADMIFLEQVLRKCVTIAPDSEIGEILESIANRLAGKSTQHKEEAHGDTYYTLSPSGYLTVYRRGIAVAGYDASEGALHTLKILRVPRALPASNLDVYLKDIQKTFDNFLAEDHSCNFYTEREC